jgi:hypothetical protein
MKRATMQLIEAVERLNMSGEIGDGMVARLHDLAAGARLEQGRVEPSHDRNCPTHSGKKCCCTGSGR